MSGQADKVRDVQERFILEWGRMSSSWGINRTMAQIHALLLITGEPWSMDDIIARLHISRGNASMNLRDLVDWGLVTRFRHPGDRKDIYQADGDIIQMFARVVRERKRREIDPTVAALRDCMAMLPEDGGSPEVVSAKERLAVLLDIFSIFDRVFGRVFETDQSYRAALKDLKEDGLLGQAGPEEKD